MSNKTAALAVGAALLIGLLTGQALAGNDDNGNPAPKPTAKTDQLVVTDRTKTGAATAAAKYADMFGRAVEVDEDEGRDLVETKHGEGIRTELLERLQEGRAAFGETAQAAGVISRRAPLGYQVTSYAKMVPGLKCGLSGCLPLP